MKLLSKTIERKPPLVRPLARAIVLLVAAGLLMHGAAGAWADDVQADRAKLYAQYARDLEDLAKKCDNLALARQAEVTRKWLFQRDEQKIYVLDQPADFNSIVSMTKLRTEQSDKLFALARRALKEKKISLAYQLASETARENPDHPDARRIIGYQKYEGAWHTRFAARKLKAGYVRHETFGWLKKADVEKYELGQRRHGSRWISAEEDARRHSDIDHGWDIETEHYIITTNLSLEQGVQLGIKLEQLYHVWQQVFVNYHAGEKYVKQWFDGRSRPNLARNKKHKVVYFRNRDEYIRKLRPLQPNIEMTLGIYMGRQNKAYFFAGKDQDPGTLFHEGTHQLFQETRTTFKDVGRKSNFWIIEGIACYMESLTRGDGFYTLGGLEAGRVPAARVRLLDKDNRFYIPLSELTSYSMLRLQRDKEDIAKIYSQSAGLSTFLMHYDGGRHRDALMAYLKTLYTTRRTGPDTLAKLTGTSYKKLDQQYREFLEGKPKKKKTSQPMCSLFPPKHRPHTSFYRLR